MGSIPLSNTPDNSSSFLGGTDDSPITQSPSDVPTPPQATQGLMDAVMGQVGNGAGLANGVATVVKNSFTQVTVVTTPVQSDFGTVAQHSLKFSTTYQSNINKFFSGMGGTILGSVTAALSAYSLSKGVAGAYKNGITGMGALSIGGSTFGLATGINMLLHGPMLTNPAGWLAAGAVIAATLAFSSITDMVENGVTAKGVITATASTIGLAIAAEGALAYAMPALVAAVPLIGPFIAIGVVLFSVLWGLFHQPASEEVAAQKLNQAMTPVIWTAGPLVLVAGGTIAALMGFPNGNQPVMASLTVPSYYFSQQIARHILPPVALNSQTPSVVVEPASGDVVIVSPTGGGNVSLTSYELSQNLQFVSSASSPANNYIPFFVYQGKTAKVNPDVVKGLTTQQDMLKAALSGNLTTQEAENAVAVAAAANKNNTSPSGVIPNTAG